jgi:hypothetical protein
MKIDSAQLRGRIERLGVYGVIGIALLIFVVAIYFAALLPMSHKVDALNGQVEALQKEFRMSGKKQQRPATASEQLQNFYAFFPPLQSTPKWLGKIQAAAKANDLILSAGEYKLEHRANDRLLRYQMVLPVSGSYEQIRGFLAGVLKSLPAASLDEINMQRDDVKKPTVEARVRLTLYLENAQQ